MYLDICNKKQEGYVRGFLKNLGFVETPASKIEEKHLPWLKEVYINGEYIGYTFFSLVSKGKGEYPKSLYLAGEKAQFGFFSKYDQFELGLVGIVLDQEKVGGIEYFSPCPSRVKAGLQNPFKQEFWGRCIDPRHCPRSGNCPGVEKKQLLDYIAEKAKDPGYKLSREENKILFGD